MIRIRDGKRKLLFTAGYLGIVGVLSYYHVPCLFQYFLHIPCPGCGMTRALLAALRLDIPGAFRYHFMFWSLPVLYLYFLCDGTVLGKKWDRAVIALIGAGFLIRWIISFFL